MAHKRIFVRVPLTGKAILLKNNISVIKACTIDISQGGVAITGFSETISTAEYQIKIITEKEQTIEFAAQLVRVDESVAGFQILKIDPVSQAVINELIFEYQTTTDFILQLDEFNLLEQKLIDAEGNEIEVTFEQNEDCKGIKP